MSATKQLKTLSPAQFAFMKWFYEKHPALARKAEEQHASLNGFLDSLTNVFNNVVTQAPELMKQYVAGKSQIDQLKINLERAKQGLYPLDAGGSVYAGQPQMSAPGGVPVVAWLFGGAVLAFIVFGLKR